MVVLFSEGRKRPLENGGFWLVKDGEEELKGGFEPYGAAHKKMIPENLGTKHV